MHITLKSGRLPSWYVMCKTISCGSAWWSGRASAGAPSPSLRLGSRKWALPWISRGQRTEKSSSFQQPWCSTNYRRESVTIKHPTRWYFYRLNQNQHSHVNQWTNSTQASSNQTQPPCSSSVIGECSVFICLLVFSDWKVLANSLILACLLGKLSIKTRLQVTQRVVCTGNKPTRYCKLSVKF